MPRTKGIDAAVAAVAKRRKALQIAKQDFIAEGWEETPSSSWSFKLRDGNGSERKKHILNFHCRDSPLSIFLKLFPPELASKIMGKCVEEDPMCMRKCSGRGKRTKMHTGQKEVFQYLSCRILVQGRQKDMGRNTEESLMNAKKELESKNDQFLMGKKKMIGVHRCFFVRIGSDEESTISDNLTGSVRVLGGYLCCDEKLYYFTGDSYLIRKVLTKPGRIGIWFYQSAIQLANGLPFLVSTSAHSSPTTTAKIISEWIKIANSKGRAVAVMDQYYMSREARQLVVKMNANVVAGLNRDRFRNWAQIMESNVKTRGRSRHMHNPNTGESLVSHFPSDMSKPRQLVYSTAFSIEKKRSLAGSIPIYDTYNVCFSTCDHFNQVLHKKGWPFDFGGNGRKGDMQKGFDYLLTAILINTHHAYCFVQKKCTDEYPWRQFCDELGMEMYNMFAYN